MSYYCKISFKKINPEDVYDFFENLKSFAKDNLEGIANIEYKFMPYVVERLFVENIPNNFADVERHEIERAKSWAVCHIFSNYYFYDKKTSMLGVFGLCDVFDKLFDVCIQFQNSTDQDYPRSTYIGSDLFLEIYDDCMKISDDEIIEKLGDDYENEEQIEYEKRSIAYKKIWSMFEDYFVRDNRIRISLFDIFERDVLKFISYCHKKAIIEQKKY